MSHQISPTHPAVVLRSQYKHMRSLLAVAMIAAVGLTAALVIVASNDSSTTSVTDAPKSAVVPSTPRLTPQQAFPGLAAEATRAAGAQADGLRYAAQAEALRNAAQADGLRYDGGPEEGTRGPVQSAGTGAQADGLRYDGGPEEGTRGSLQFSGTR